MDIFALYADYHDFCAEWDLDPEDPASMATFADEQEVRAEAAWEALAE